MIKNMWFGLIAHLIALILLSGCSVKEDRTACPCLLTLDFSQTDTLKIPSVQICVDDGTVTDEYSLEASEFMPETTFLVSKGVMDINIHSGLDGRTELKGGIKIPYGEDAPSLYSFSSKVDASGESVRENVRFHKNHCRLKLFFKNSLNNGFALCLKGNVSGYELSGMPVEGAFSYEMPIAEDGSYQAVLPRQKDSSLMLEIDDGTEVLKRFALGEYLVGGGYDWTEDDLEDVKVVIDWSMTAVTLVVQGWDWAREYEIVI